MNKMTKIFLAAGIICCVSGGALIGVGRAFQGQNYVRTADLNHLKGDQKIKEGTITVEKKKLASFSKIQADLKNVDFNIFPSGDADAYLSYTVQKVKKKDPISYEVQDDTLKIQESKAHTSSYYVHVDISFLTGLAGDAPKENYTNEVTLYLPEKMYQEAVLKMGNGDCSIEKMQTDNLEVASDDGDVEVKQVTGKHAALHTAYGDISCKNAVLEQGSIRLDDGDLSVRDSSLKQVNLENAYGDISLKESSYETGEIQLKDGDLSGSGTTYTGEVSINNDYGDISLKLKDEAYTIKATTKYGDIGISGIKGTQYSQDDSGLFEATPDNPVATLTLESKDGDISLHR